MARPVLPADGDLTWGPTLRAAVFDTSDRADGRLPANVRTATSYTVVAGDIATTVYRDFTVANTVTIPTGVGQPEDRLLIRQDGTGLTTVVAGTGMTPVVVGKTGTSFALAGQGAIVEIVWKTTTRFYIDGALA